MALKQETKDKLKAFGFDVDALIGAVTAADEVDYAVPEDVTVIKTADLTARDANKLKEGERIGETRGEVKGKELAAKAFRKRFGLDDSIGVDLDKVVDAVNGKLSQGDKALQDQVVLLQRDKDALKREKEEAERRAAEASNDAKLITFFPPNRTTSLSDSERLALVKMNFSFEDQDGKPVVKRNGDILRNKDSQSPIDPKQAIADYFQEKSWITTEQAAPPQGGRGGVDNTPPPTNKAGIKKASDFEKNWMEKNPGKNIMHEEYISALTQQIKEVPDFDLHN